MRVNNNKRRGGIRGFDTYQRVFGLAIVYLLVCAGLSACYVRSIETANRYITWDGLEPDKWASVWLVNRHIDPGAEIIIRPPGSPVKGGTAFGTPQAKYRRQHGQSIYSSLLKGFNVTDPALQEMAKILHDIEVTPWASDVSHYSVQVEQAFRDLQENFPDRKVPITCYSHFFDLTFQTLQQSSDEKDWQVLHRFSQKPQACAGQGQVIATHDTKRWVRTVQIGDVLNRIGAGDRIIFVDARETREFQANHIPGAVNLKLREVNEGIKDRFADTDLVIAYCIKDFRGYELAKALADVGVDNAAIMNPYGIAGWRALGLPTTGIKGLTETTALERLSECARGTRQCS